MLEALCCPLSCIVLIFSHFSVRMSLAVAQWNSVQLQLVRRINSFITCLCRSSSLSVFLSVSSFVRSICASCACLAFEWTNKCALLILLSHIAFVVGPTHTDTDRARTCLWIQILSNKTIIKFPPNACVCVCDCGCWYWLNKLFHPTEQLTANRKRLI